LPSPKTLPPHHLVLPPSPFSVRDLRDWNRQKQKVAYYSFFPFPTSWLPVRLPFPTFHHPPIKKLARNPQLVFFSSPLLCSLVLLLFVLRADPLVFDIMVIPPLPGAGTPSVFSFYGWKFCRRTVKCPLVITGPFCSTPHKFPHMFLSLYFPP